MASSKGDGSQIVGLTRGSERNSYDIRVELWAYGCGKSVVGWIIAISLGFWIH